MTDITPENDGPAPQCDLTPEQEHSWDATMSMMAWTCPGFRHLFYRMLASSHNAGMISYSAVMTKSVLFAATDGESLLVNPDTFFKFGLSQRTYIVGHEVVHNVYGDVELLNRCTQSGTVPMNDGTTRPFHNPMMQKAMDARINALLDQSKIGKRADKFDGHDCGHFDPEVSSDDNVLDVYKKYYEKEFPEGEPEDQDQGQDPNNPGGFDNLLPPGNSTGQTPSQASQHRNTQQWAVEVQAAQTIEQTRSQGKMAAALKRMFQ